MGNLLYYRYMNPAIVAPDAFDIIEVSAGGQLTTEQRRNLGSVAKMLQHAASNKMFLGDNAHLNPINEYLSASHLKFRSDVSCSRNIKRKLFKRSGQLVDLESFFLLLSWLLKAVFLGSSDSILPSSITGDSSSQRVTSPHLKTSSTWISTRTWSPSPNPSSTSPSERLSTLTQ